jgi:hypothetical protein
MPFIDPAADLNHIESLTLQVPRLVVRREEEEEEVLNIYIYIYLREGGRGILLSFCLCHWFCSVLLTHCVSHPPSAGLAAAVLPRSCPMCVRARLGAVSGTDSEPVNS